MDIHKVVDVFNKRLDVAKYARMVPFEEIERNEFNLNLPRYIDSQVPEDLQDIAGHLQGGIPVADIDALERYWAVCPRLRQALFKERRPGYFDLAVDKAAIKSVIYEHPEFADFVAGMNAHFAVWRETSAATLKGLQTGCHPKEIIAALAEDLLVHYVGKPLIDPYDIYQHLMDYWDETMQDDCYLIAADGWKAETTRIVEKDKMGKERDKGWTCDLVPKGLIGVLRIVGNKKDAEAAWSDSLDAAWKELKPSEYDEFLRTVASSRANASRLTNLTEDQHLRTLKNDKGNITKGAINRRLKGVHDESEKRILAAYLSCDAALKTSGDRSKQLREAAQQEICSLLEQASTHEALADLRVLKDWLKLNAEESDIKKRLKAAETALEAQAYAMYPKLAECEVKMLVVDDKWLAALDALIHGEMDRVSRQLTQRVKELAERYEIALPQMVNRVTELEAKVNGHLEQMGFAWK